MKRFKRPISEVAKGLFHQGSGDSKPVIPNLGVNSKKAESSSPAKLGFMPAPKKEKTQSEKNAETRKSGKAVSYKDAYADADKKKYKTYDEFEKAAKSYNKKKYDSTNPTADAKKAGKTKAQLAKDVAAKNKPAETTTTDDKTTTTTNNKKVDEKKVKVTEAKTKLAKTKKDNKVEKINAKAEVAAAKGKTGRAERLKARAERKATGKSKKDQGRNIFGRKTKKQKAKEAAAAESSAAKYKKSAPTKKALVGKQKNLPPEIQAKIKAAPGKYGKKHK